MRTLICLNAIFVLVLAGCGGGGGGGSASLPSIYLDGTVIAGLTDGATVTAYSIMPDGGQGQEIATGTTGPDGTFSLDLGGFRGDLLVVVSGGTYTDEATGLQETLTTPIRTVVGDVTENTTIVVTPFTELAVLMAGSFFPGSVAAAGQIIGNLLGGLDVLNTLPADVTGNVDSNSRLEKDYGLALATLSQWMNNSGLTMSEALTSLANDLADYSCDLTGNDLLTALSDFVGSNRNGAGITLSETSLDESITSAMNYILVPDSNEDPEPGLVTAVDDSRQVDEDGLLVIRDLLDNDSSGNGNVLNIVAVDSLSGHGGAVTLNVDGSVDYTPASDYFGPDTFNYMAGDSDGNTDAALVTVSVLAVNDAPVAVDDPAIVTTFEDKMVTTGSVLDNDSDVDGDTLEVIAFTALSDQGGDVEYFDAGVFSYTPPADFNGTDTFTYTVTDGNGSIDLATVGVIIVPVTDAPMANPDSVTTDEDTPVTTSDVTINDVDADGDLLTISGFDSASLSGGTITAAGANSFTYSPPADFFGTDSFNYTLSDGTWNVTGTVMVTVNSVNDPPVGAGDLASTREDVPVITGNVLLNDTDVDSRQLSIAQFDHSTSQGGSVSLDPFGFFTIVPAPDYFGTDDFTYTVSDGSGGTDLVTVTITVTEENDLPVLADRAETMWEDAVLTLSSLVLDASDADGDVLHLRNADLLTARGGNLHVGTDVVVYIPLGDYDGEDSFTVFVEDGRGGVDAAVVTVTVLAVNDPPVANDDTNGAVTFEDTPVNTSLVLANDVDGDGDTLQVVAWDAVSTNSGLVDNRGDGTFNYTPPLNFSGVDTFTYTVSDGSPDTASATVTVTVLPVNDQPTLSDTTLFTDEDTPVTTGNLMLLAFDPDTGDTLTLVVDSVTTSGGSVLDNLNGTVTYTPTADYNGEDHFTWRVVDSQGAVAAAVITVVVRAQNDPPVANSDTLRAYEDLEMVTGNVLANDSDADGDELSVQSFDNLSVAGGAVAYLGDGVFRYTPVAQYNGNDSFIYAVDDGHGAADTTTVFITVNSVMDIPVANDDYAIINEDTSVVIAVLANDTDGDGDVLSFNVPGTDVISAMGGTVTIIGTALRYTPAAHFNGSDTFSYTVTDGSTNVTAQVTVTVRSINDLPIAVDDTVGTQEDVSVVFNVTSNDTDADNDILTVIGVPLYTVNQGQIENHGSGVFTYTPRADYSGTDTFSYAVVDGAGAFDNAVVTIIISPRDDAPVAADDALVIYEDSSGVVGVLLNDTDADGQPLSINSFDSTSIAGGSIASSGDSLVYTPALNYNGTDRFSYTVSDGTYSDSAVVVITVRSVNDSPVATPDVVTCFEDATVTTSYVHANDSDVDGDTLSVITADFLSSQGAPVTNNGTEPSPTPHRPIIRVPTPLPTRWLTVTAARQPAP